MTTESIAPVVVVGGGPVGLIAALEFAAHDVPTVVFESGPAEVSPEWRGSTLHPPTLEILDGLGLATQALRDGIRVDALQYRDLVLDDVVEMPFAVLADRTRFPFRIQYEQYKLVRQLRDAAARHALVDVRFGHTVMGAEPGDEDTPATIVVQLPDGSTKRVEARWVVAADGSHSAVRTALGVTMLGDTYTTASLVVATDSPFDDLVPGLTPVSYWTGPRGRMSLIRTPDTWRVAITIDDNDAPTPHPDFLHAMDLLAGNRDWTDLRQHQRYRSHQRVASTFRVGRVVLAGDAAHLSATTGGMGLNSGIHDAHELAQVLGPAILEGRGEHQTAATVASSRQRVAHQLVQPAIKTARDALDVTDENSRRRRLQHLHEIAADERRLAAYLAVASMLEAVDLTPECGFGDRRR